MLIVGILLLFIAITCLSITAFSNPGIVPKQTLDQLSVQKQALRSVNKLEEHTECQMCNVMRPAGTQHCFECGVCVLELDHHCPWTGKCIGQKNLRAFYSFLATLTLLVVYVAACTFVWVVTRAVRG